MVLFVDRAGIANEKRFLIAGEREPDERSSHFEKYLANIISTTKYLECSNMYERKKKKHI